MILAAWPCRAKASTLTCTAQTTEVHFKWISTTLPVLARAGCQGSGWPRPIRQLRKRAPIASRTTTGFAASYWVPDSLADPAQPLLVKIGRLCLATLFPATGPGHRRGRRRDWTPSDRG